MNPFKRVRPVTSKKLGRLLREFREEASLTLAELSDKSGVCEGHIANLEHGRHSPTIETLQKLLRVFRVSLVDAFDLLQN